MSQIAAFTINTILGTLAVPDVQFGIDASSFLVIAPFQEWQITIARSPGVDGTNLIPVVQWAGGKAAPPPTLTTAQTVGGRTILTIGCWAYAGNAPANAPLPILKVAIFRFGTPIANV